MRIQSINTNQNQYKPNFQMKVDSIYVGDAIKAIFGKGPVSLAKNLIKQDSTLSKIGDDVTVKVARSGYMGIAETHVIVKKGVKNAEGHGNAPFEDNIIATIKNALKNLH